MSYIKKADLTDTEMSHLIHAMHNKDSSLKTKDDVRVWKGNLVSIGQYICPEKIFYSKVYGWSKSPSPLTFVQINNHLTVDRIFKSDTEYVIVEKNKKMVITEPEKIRASFELFSNIDTFNKRWKLILPSIFGKHPEIFSLVDNRCYLPYLYIKENIPVTINNGTHNTIKTRNGKFLMFPHIVVRNLTETCDLFIVLPDDSTLYRVNMTNFKKEAFHVDETNIYSIESEIAIEIDKIKELSKIPKLV